MTQKQCSIEGCNNPHNARGYCGKHYARWQRHGDASVVRYSVQKSARVEDFLSTGIAECRHHGQHSDWKLRHRKDPRGHTYRALECRICICERSRMWRLKNPEPHRKSLSSLSVTASRLLSGAKARATKNDLPFNITKNWIIDQFNQQDGKCALSGRRFQLEYTTGGRRENAMSLDQIVPGAGYTTGNTQLVAWCVNEMKKRMSQNQFLTLCYDVSRHSRVKD